MRNPKWHGGLIRDIGIARTNDPSATDGFGEAEGNLGHIDEKPLAPLEDDVENSSVYYEASTGAWYLFASHIDPANKAVVLDKHNTLAVKGRLVCPPC